MQNTRPGIGGPIVEIPGLPDDESCGGFLDVYTRGERAGATVRGRDIPLMIQDQTLFVATERMDGKPAVGEAFVAVSYDNTEVTTTHDFETEYANGDLGILAVTSAEGTAAGQTKLTIAGNTPSAALKVKVGAQPTMVKTGMKPGNTWTPYNSGTELPAATGTHATEVELDGTGKVVKAGSTMVTAKAGV